MFESHRLKSALDCCLICCLSEAADKAFVIVHPPVTFMSVAIENSNSPLSLL